MNTEKSKVNPIMSIASRILGSLVYRLYILPSSLLALWGLLFLCVSVLFYMGWGKYLIQFAVSQDIDSINLTNNDFIQFVAIASIAGALMFEVIGLIFRRSINYRAVERKFRLILIITCWPVANYLLSISSNKYNASWSAILFLVFLGLSLIGLEVLAGKLWRAFEKMSVQFLKK